MNYRFPWVSLSPACTVSTYPSEEIIQPEVAVKHVKEELQEAEDSEGCALRSRHGCTRVK